MLSNCGHINRMNKEKLGDIIVGIIKLNCFN